MSEESTYRLLVQQTNQPGMPLRHVGDSRSPPWALPLNGPASSSAMAAAAAPVVAAKRGKANGGRGKSSGAKVKKCKTGDGDDGKGVTRIGCWEELFDAVSGKKIWYNAVTLKKTSKDPFF